MSFLHSLDKLRANGKNKWRSRCPVHNGSNATALSIVQWSDGAFGVKCFSCDANGTDVFNALGLPLDELFGYKTLDRPRQYVTQMQKDENKEDQFFMAIYDAAKGRGDVIAYSDHKRHKLTVQRMRGYEQLLNA